MVQNFNLPPMGFGPGSQPDPNEGELDYLPMPGDMRTYAPSIPEIDDNGAFAPALARLADIAAACDGVAEKGGTVTFGLSDLDTANRQLIAETMGEGEVSIRAHGLPAVAVQESVFAGVWQVSGSHIDAIEVGAAPSIAGKRAHTPRRPARQDAPRTAGVLNAPPLLVELLDKSASWTPLSEVHVINLSLLPHTEADLAWLDASVGLGSVDVLSRGYGNCRVTATAMPHVWRVQFFNSMDTLILDTFEVTGMPEVVIAASEDLSDSGSRLREVIGAIG